MKRILSLACALTCTILLGEPKGTVTGVISGAVRDGFDPNWIWVSVRTGEETVAVGCWDREYSLEGLRALIDAEATFSCTKARFETWRGSDRFYYIMTSAPRLLRRPPDDPFQTVSVSDDPARHRQRHTGLVLLSGKSRFYVQGPGVSVLIVTPQDDEPRPEAGDTVTVAGFLNNGTFANQLTEAKVRIESDEPRRTPEIHTVPPNELTVRQRKPIRIPSEIHYGRLIRTRGRVLKSGTDLVRDGRLALDCGDTEISVDISDLDGESLPEIEAGCLVEVAGLCLFEFAVDNAALPVPMFRSMTVIPGSSADMRVIARAPWWTPARLLIAVCALLAALVGVFVWNFILQRLVDRRSRQLLKAEIAGVSSELRVEERTRLAVELHDSISQNLSGASMQVNAAEVFLAKSPARTKECLRLASETIDSCREELRNCIWDLRNHALEESSVDAAVRKTLQPHLGTAALSVRFNVPRAKISDNTMHALLRIIRELVTNAIRHGHATSVSVAGAFEDDRLLFSVSDNGCGFDHTRHPSIGEGHFGLQGIKERIQRSGGEMRIEDRTGGGTKVKLWIRSRC